MKLFRKLSAKLKSGADTEIVITIRKVKEDNITAAVAFNNHSCSLAEALKRQDLFINSSLAQLAGSMIWNLFRNIAIDIRGFYLNLETLRVNPIKV